jgi:hypothetical protein
MKEAAGGSKDDSVPVVEMESEGKDTRQGPNSKFYERCRGRRANAGGFHLLFNAFWLVTSFCIFHCTCLIACTKSTMG